MKAITMNKPWIVRPTLLLIAVTACSFAAAQEAGAEKESEADETRSIDVAGEAFVVEAPAAWERQQPRVRIIEHEFVIPAPTDEDDQPLAEPGRMTVMISGGGVEANVERWVGQFRTPAGEAPEPKIEELEVAELPVHLVTLEGVFLDQRGPFAPATRREDFQMLGAIVDLPGGADLFLKLTAPAKTASAAAKGFRRMVESLRPAE